MAAWDVSCFGDRMGVPNASYVPTFQCLESLFRNLITSVSALIGVGLFVMLLVGGFRFLTSGGDPKKLQMARGTIASALIGVVLIVSAYLILRIISVFTGVTSLLQFTVPK